MAKLNNKTLPKSKTIHFIGIGGAGMSPIAKILIESGYTVTGSDLKESVNTIRLKDLGAEIYIKHQSQNTRKADIVVISGAIPESNPELMKAREDKVPVLVRAEMLAAIMNDFPKQIAVTGTHGKTTTSSMITRMLDTINKHPTFVIGSEMLDYGTSAKLNGNEYIVVESDESDGSFLCINPNIGVINNIEAEHMDFYKTWENLCEHFKTFMDKIIKNKGYLIVNNDDETLMSLVKDYSPPSTIAYGIKNDAPIMAKNIKHLKTGVSYSLFIDGKKEGQVNLSVQGIHNVYNSLAAISIGLCENASLDLCIEGLNQFTGTKRRLQLIGQRDNVTIYDDYAHHPTEIALTLDGIKKSLKKPVTCIFQPHRYTRTQHLCSEFAEALTIADTIIVTEIFASNDPKIEGVSGKNIVDLIKKNSEKNAVFIEKKSNVPPYIVDELNKHTIIVTMCAGDIHTVGKEIIKRLQFIASSTKEKSEANLINDDH